MKIKDVMIPLSDFAVLSAEDTLADAQMVLEKTREANRTHNYRALLVCDDKNHVIGTVCLMDILKGLDSKYKDYGDFQLLSRFGLSQKFYEYITKDVSILQKPLDDICGKAARIKVNDIMQPPEANAYIDLEENLNMAIHRLVVLGHDFLIVTQDGKVEGILRLVDVAEEIGHRIKACGFPPPGQ
ncbi:MAG: CBS domain-containing protein [Desulfobacterales bacterium]